MGINMIKLIPAPKEYTKKSGSFKLDDALKINSEFDLPLLKLEQSDDANIIIKKDDSLSPEAYTMDISESEIVIRSSDKIGAYYAFQSLRQLSRFELGGREVECCSIVDAPKYKWRGLELDESRHFWGKDNVKHLLDQMFMVKLNVFHWHLTDDTGWRIEIKKYPKLTEIGSVRKGTQVGGWHSKEMINEEYSGFYTQEDIKEIIAYAMERGIMIVPEIDFPAHSAAALASYPYLACREIETEVPGYFGGFIPEFVHKNFSWNRTLCLGKDKVIEFIFDVIDEVCDLFPAPYFHIGGDETPINEWKKCPHCQKVIKENNLENEYGLQGWLNNKVLEHLKTKGKQLIGWNEVLKTKNIDKSVIAQYWTPQRDKNAEKHANTGGSIILSNHQSFYFDMPYAMYPVSCTYNYSPEKFGIKKESLPNVLGYEGELWTEWIGTVERLQLLSHPRMEALSEVAWSPNKVRSFSEFARVFDEHKPLLEKMGIVYASNGVSMPKGLIHRSKIKKLFHKGDPELEDKLNKEYLVKEKV